MALLLASSIIVVGYFDGITQLDSFWLVTLIVGEANFGFVVEYSKLATELVFQLRAFDTSQTEK